jgi:16S rRNA (adenine1518-N6/adenine1519-N6)-dimethyltransferase
MVATGAAGAPPRPRLDKSLGQHHLADGRLTRPLVEFLRPEGERVVEIGPGGGVLTAELLAAGARVDAVELDPAWALSVVRRLPAGSPGRLRVVVADALDLAWDRLSAGSLVTGNLPYNVGTAIVQRWLREAVASPRAAFLLQHEVVERLTAASKEDGRGAYGSLSVLTAVFAEARVLGRVKPGSFRPPPKVDSAFVGLTRRAPPPGLEDPATRDAFLAFVRTGFGQRRKTLPNPLASLPGGKSRARAALEAAGLPATARAEDLDLARWVALFAAWRAVVS